MGFNDVKSYKLTFPYTGSAWKVKACGKMHDYVINFTVSPYGGTTYTIFEK